MKLCEKNQRFRLRQFGGRSEQQILHMICSKQNDLPNPESSATPDVAITLPSREIRTSFNAWPAIYRLSPAQ